MNNFCFLFYYDIHLSFNKTVALKQNFVVICVFHNQHIAPAFRYFASSQNDDSNIMRRSNNVVSNAESAFICERHVMMVTTVKLATNDNGVHCCTVAC